MMGRRKPDRRKKANRRLTPEEQLARSVATPSRGKKKRKSKVHSHAKPLDPASGPDRKPRSKRKPSRIREGFRRVFAPVRHSLTGEWLGGPEVIRHLPFAAFLGALFIGYIYLEYRYEYDERAIKEGRKEVRNLRHHEQALRGRFESQLQRSRLDEAMADVNLTAPDSPPVLLPDANPTSP